MNILLIDHNSLDRAALRAHMESLYQGEYALVDVRTLADLNEVLESSYIADAVVMAQLPDGIDMQTILADVSTRYPIATLVLVSDSRTYSISMSSLDPARLTFLSYHELARLPLILTQRDWNLRQLDRALDLFPDFQDMHADIYREIVSLTADYVYFGWIEPDQSVKVHYRSDALLDLTGYSHEELNIGTTEMLMHPDDLNVLAARRDALRRGETRVDEFRIVTKDGRVLWIRDHARSIPANDGSGRWLVIGAAQDITHEKLLHSRLAVQASVLEMVARGEEQDSVLRKLTEVVEEQISDTMCSVQRADPGAGVLRPAVHSSLPDLFTERISAVPINPEHGACGSAAYSGELTIVTDVGNDRRFEHYRDLISEFGIGAVWSTPIFASSGNVAGTFALYFQAARVPVDHEIAVLESAAQIAGIALDVAEREAQRQLAEAQYQTLVEQTPAITLMAAPENPLYITYISPQFSEFSDIPAEDILRNPERVHQFIHPDDRGVFEQATRKSDATGGPIQTEFRIRRFNGEIAWVQASISLIRDQHGEPLHWLGIMIDVTDRNKAIRQMTESNRRYRSLFDENLNSIVILNYEGQVVDLNPAAERISGYSREELLGQTLLWMFVPEDRERAERYFLESRAGISCQFPLTMINKQGERVELSASQSPVVVDGEIVGVSSISEDVTERKRLESQLLHQAYHDRLTGLPNRIYFDQMLSNAMETLDRSSELAILFLDLNNFKVINDSLGHDVGDRYLSQIAQMLRDVIPEDAVVARFGGDEFTVLLPPAPDALKRATEISREIMTALHIQISIDGYELGTNVCIGIASTTRDSSCPPRELIRRADIALYDAKRDGRESNYRIFHERMDEWVFERLWIERDLRYALANKEFTIHYQPLIDIPLGEVGVLEALVRWNHPERGQLLPDQFLRIAEETGHILDIDQWVMETACQQIADWNRANPDSPPIFAGINMSARAFWHTGLVDRVMTVLQETGLDPGLLCIEITESTLMRDAEQARKVVQELRANGVLIAVDDFGTGYSSLSYLRTLPIDVLKIDRTFITGLEDDDQQTELVRAIVAMAGALGLEVVAEGIESQRQYERARELGCKLAQGFHISDPKPFDEITKLINNLLATAR